MNTDLFQHEICRTTSVLGRKTETRVIFTGTGACTDGTNVILPAMKKGVDIDADTADVLRGYVDHEAGHVKHTDFKVVGPWRNKWRAAGREWIGRVENALEDIRLERLVLKEYPGSATNLLAVTTDVNRKYLGQVAAGQFTPEGTGQPQDARRHGAHVDGTAALWRADAAGVHRHHRERVAAGQAAGVDQAAQAGGRQRGHVPAGREDRRRDRRRGRAREAGARGGEGARARGA